MNLLLVKFLMLLMLGQSAPATDKANAEKTSQDRPITFQIQSEQPGTCESNRVLLDEITAVLKMAGKDELVVVIARQGKGELATMNQRRLYTVKTYLDLPSDKFVSAIGEPTSGNALIEFYIKGKPYMAIPIARNQELEVGDCTGEFSKSKFYLSKKRAGKR